MFATYLKVSGKIDNEIKEKDGKYYLLLNTKIYDEDSNKSLIYIDITKTIYKKIKDNYKGSYVNIFGEIQPRKTKKEVPYIYMKCRNFLFIQNPKEIEKIDNRLKLEDENKIIEKQEIKKEEKPIDIQDKNYVPWYSKINKEEFELIETTKVGLVEEEHLKASMFFNKGWKADDKPIAVRKSDDGTYTLVTGFKWYVYAKLLNKPYIKAHITELSFKEFRDKYVDA